MGSLIILPDWLITSALKPPRKSWGIRIQDGKIADIDSNLSLLAKYPDDEAWDASGQVLSPGFVNAHTHLYGVLAHGIPLEKAPSGFWVFLEEFWWPLIEDSLDKEMINAATDYRCASMLKSGVTSFYDCTEAPNALPGCLFSQAEVVRKWGIRSILSFEATQRVSKENGLLGLKENTDFIKVNNKSSIRDQQDRGSAKGAAQSTSPKSMVTGMMCHHTTFTCSGDFIQQAYEIAQDLDVLLHAHVAEGTYEPAQSLKNNGMPTFHYYQNLGVANSRFLASQCVQINEEEISLMAEAGVRMVHMPLSNCEVGGGIAPVPQLIEAGVTVGLGSDGYIDDFFEVMRGAFLIHKANHLDPGVMPANLVWYLATEGGARALNLDKVGRIQTGWQADLQLIKPDLPTPLEAHNLFDQLLLYQNASQVDAVWVAGEVKVQDGYVIGADWDQLKAKTNEAAIRLWKKA